MIKVIFMGTPEIGASALKALFGLNDVEVVGVVCQPDREFDRKKNLVFSPVKKLALEKEIKIFQPEKIGQIYDELLEISPDVMLTCAFGQFVPEKILAIPKYGAFNLHASLLPKLRGGAPIHWAVINREQQTGISLMKMIKKMDAGDYLIQYKLNIDEKEIMSSLYEKLSQLVNEMVLKEFHKLVDFKQIWTPQDEDEVTFAYNIKKEDCLINFNKTALEIDALIRGLNNKPLAIWEYEKLQVKVLEAKLTVKKSNWEPGKIVSITKYGLELTTNTNNILITKIQLPNKSPVEISALINGKHPFKIN